MKDLLHVWGALFAGSQVMDVSVWKYNKYLVINNEADWLTPEIYKNEGFWAGLRDFGNGNYGLLVDSWYETRINLVDLPNSRNGHYEPSMTPPPPDHRSVRKELDNFLKNDLPDACAKALKALNVTNKNLLDAFDNATFASDKSFSNTQAKTFYKTGKGSSKAITIKTKNGSVDDFSGSPVWLIHELTHGSS